MITCKWLLSVYSLVYHMISSLGETLDTMITWEWFHFSIYFYINCFLLYNSFIDVPHGSYWIMVCIFIGIQKRLKVDWFGIYFLLSISWYLFFVLLQYPPKILLSSSVWQLFPQNSPWVILGCDMLHYYFLIGELHWLWNDAGLLIEINYYFFTILSLTAHIKRK